MSQQETAGSVHERSRQRLYDIIATEGESLGEKRRKIVELGAEYLGVSIGFVSGIDVDAGRFEVFASTDDDILAEGAVYDLSETYCRRCVESGSSLTVSDAIADGWRGDPAYEEHGLGCYLGTPIHVDGDLDGTVCFADPEAREADFSSTERAFVELAARLLGRERELGQHERQLDQRDRERDREERKYKSLLTTAPDAIFLVDVETDEIAEANGAAAALTGYDRDRLVGEQVGMIHPEGRAKRYKKEAFRQSVERDGATVSGLGDGTPILVERANGTTVPVEITATEVDLDGRTCIQSVLRDISDRRERERELRLKSRAIEEAPVGVTIADADAGDTGLVYANERFEEVTGYDWDDVAGRNCRFLQGEGTDSEATGKLREGIEAARPVRTELLNYREDGTPFWNELSVAPIENGSGEVTHFVGFQQDVTGRKRQERLVNVLNRVLRHNLRNGMNVVLARSRQLADEIDGESTAVAAIRRRAEELAALAEQARAIDDATDRTATVQRRDVVDIVSSVADDVASEYPDADVSVHAPDAQPVCAAGTLRAAIGELGRNAATHASPDPTVAFAVEAAGETVEVRVSDDGPGLPPEERAILDGGDETPLEHGSGLGLWFVNWAVTGVGGQVSATVGDGTSITLSLPAPDSTESFVSRQAAFTD